MSSFWCSKYEMVIYKGVSKTAVRWAHDKKLPWETVKKRIQRGYSWTSALELTEDDIKPYQYPLFDKKRVYKKNKSFVNSSYYKN